MLIVVNYLAVIAAAVAAMVVGFLWYGPLFGKQWMKLRGMDPSSMAGGKFPADKFAIQFVASLVTAFFLAEFMMWVGAFTMAGMLVLAGWVWLGFYATTMLDSVLWEKAPWLLYMFNAAQRLVTLLVMAAIIGLWH
jgi:hypothetical protein